MSAVDSFVGEGLSPSPYKEVLAERDALILALRCVLRFALPITRHDVQDERTARALLQSFEQ